VNNPNSNQYVSGSGSGTLEIAIDQSGNDGEDVNLNARTEFDKMFRVTNRGTQAIALYILYDPADTQSGFMPGPDDSGRLDPNDPDLGLECCCENGGARTQSPGRPRPDRPEHAFQLFSPGESTTLGVATDTRDFDADTTNPLFDGMVIVTAFGLDLESL
jgi:hypothetical protein